MLGVRVGRPAGPLPEGVGRFLGWVVRFDDVALAATVAAAAVAAAAVAAFSALVGPADAFFGPASSRRAWAKKPPPPPPPLSPSALASSRACSLARWAWRPSASSWP